MQFTIRQATEDDFDELLEVLAEGDAFHSDALPRMFRRSSGLNHPWDYIEQGINSENDALLVAESDGELIGAIRLSVNETMPHPILVPRRYVQVHEITVKERFRHAGVGKALMEKGHQWAASKGIHEIELTVWEFNKDAIALYEKLGYVTMNRRMKKAIGR